MTPTNVPHRIRRWPGAAGLLSLVSGLAFSSGLAAQGLMDIGPSFLEDVDIPLSGRVSSALGWDSDAGSRDNGIATRGQSSADSEGESVVWQNSLDLNYGTSLKDRGRLGFSAHYSNLWYFDPPPGVGDFDHNGRVALNYSQQVSHQLSISNRLYVAYETDPNYDIGMSVSRPTTGYFLFTNRLSAAYQWTHRFSTDTGYGISSILYDDDGLDRESYYRHQLSQEFRYAFKRRVVGTLTYRYNLTKYDENDDADSSQHSILAGVNHQWNRRLSLTARAGVDYRVYDEGLDDQVKPRVELGMGYLVAKRTSLRWNNMFSLDDSGRAGLQSGYSYRSSFGVGHGFTRRLNGNVSLNYVHSDYQDSTEGLDDAAQDAVYTSLGFSYVLWRNISVNGSYSYSLVSEDGLDDYSRHRLFFGASYAF